MTIKKPKSNSIIYGMAVATTIVLATGCVATSVVEENTTSAELAPMAKPTLMLNQRVVQMDEIKGEEIHFEITKINDDGTYSGLNSTGCGWTSMGDFVSPSLSWNDCSTDPEWHSGENKNMKKKGELWPLEIGNKASYTYDQHNARGANSGQRTRKCTVEEVVNIEVNDEQLDTFKVVCKRVQPGWWQTDVSYFSPKKGRSVKWVQTNKNDGVARHVEFLRVEQL